MRYLVLLLLWGVSSFAQQGFDASSSQKFQDDLNESFRNPKKSPLPQEDIKTFEALDFFAIDPKYFVTATFVRTENEQPFEMKTTTDRAPKYLKYATATFTIDGKSYDLNIYQSLDLMQKPGYEKYLFLPFSDLTNGKESYIGGRYIELEIPDGDEIEIDFNKAYNPYCAYNYKYSCPRVPLENDLSVAILAGVKKYHD